MRVGTARYFTKNVTQNIQHKNTVRNVEPLFTLTDHDGMLATAVTVALLTLLSFLFTICTGVYTLGQGQ